MLLVTVAAMDVAAEFFTKQRSFYTVGQMPDLEARRMHWNFVSSSVDRIEQADRRAQRFNAIAGEAEFIPLPPDPPGPVTKR